MDKTNEYAYIPVDRVIKMPLADLPPTLVESRGPQGRNYLKDSNAKSGIEIKRIPGGKLYISSQTRVAAPQGANNEVAILPRALLVTDEGEEIALTYPQILRRIDEFIHSQAFNSHDLSKLGAQGVVRLLSVNNEEKPTFAVKLFRKTQNTFERPIVSGLEQAQAYLQVREKLKDLKCSVPIIYFASQDMIVMDNIEIATDFVDFQTYARREPEQIDSLIQVVFSIQEKLIELAKENHFLGVVDLLLRVTVEELMTKSTQEKINMLLNNSISRVQKHMRFKTGEAGLESLLIDINT